MHILPEILRSDAQRTIPYASASVLKSRTNCTIVSEPVVFRSLVQKVGA